MDQKSKIERLKAIKEEFARAQARHTELCKLEEAAEATHLSQLLENDLEQAELILAAQDVMTRLQEMAEDLAKTSARDLFPLADRMKAAFGPDAARSFEQSATHALDSAMEAVRQAKDELGTAILKIEGKIPASDMAMDTSVTDEPDMATDGDAAIDAAFAGADEFAGADAASGPEAEPLGRSKKESVEATKPALRENAFDYRSAGRVLIEREGLDSLLGWILTEAAAAMPADEFTEFAKNISLKAAKDPEATAGWIGKKRYGAAAMAQLAAPTMTATMAPGMGICESEELEERKFDDEDDDHYGRDGKRKSKGRDVARNQARARKHMSEGEKIAEGIAKVIEHNIATTGKGNAAQVVRAFSERANSLLEGEGEALTIARLTDMFEGVYGMKPAAFSMKKLQEFMSTTDQKKAAGVMTKVASKMATDKSAANKPVSSMMQDMDGQERAAATKMINQMKKDGKDPKKVGDFVSNADSMIDPDKTNESELAENINACHWPVGEFGQYKGEPMQTDYGKLKAKSGSEAKTGGETKSEEPKEEAPQQEEATAEKPAEETSEEK